MLTFLFRLGIITEKLNTTEKLKADTAVFSASGDETDYSKREDLYNKHRKELVQEFKHSNKKIDKIYRGFFLDERHLASYFEYLTETPPLNQNIEDNLRTHLGNLSEIDEVYENIHFISRVS